MVRVVLDDGLTPHIEDVPSVTDEVVVDGVLWVLSAPYRSPRALGSEMGSKVPDVLPDIPRYVPGDRPNIRHRSAD